MDSQESAADQPEDATPAEEHPDDTAVQGEAEPTGPEAGDPPRLTGLGGQPLQDILSGFESANRDRAAELSDMIAKAMAPSLKPLEDLVRQQASWAKTFVVPDFAASLPKFNAQMANLPGLDAAVRQMSQSVLAGFDFGSLLPKIDFSEMFKFEPAGGWDKWWGKWWPPNWPKDIDLDLMQAILNDEGLPLVWVPRAEVVTELLASASRQERVAVLVARRAEVAEDCLASLAEITHPRLVPQRRLLTEAVQALAAGHDAAAQSLAVLVTETAVLRAGAAGHIDGLANDKKLYKRVKDTVPVNLDEAPVWLLRVAASLAPVAAFFTPFFPHNGDPVPEAMSRHVTVHFADDDHYTEAHAVVAVLLMASVARGLQQGWEIWEPQTVKSDGTADSTQTHQDRTQGGSP